MRRAWVFILLLIFALAEALGTGSRLFYYLAYTIAGLLLVSFLLAWYNIRWLRLARDTLSKRAQVGRMAEERFVLQNTGWLPKLWVEVRDHSSLPGHRASQVVGSLGARKRRGWSVNTLCRRRGRYRLGPVSIISGDPFGLFQFQRNLPSSSSIVVYPALVDLPGFSLPVGSMQGSSSYRRRTHYTTPNVSSIRDYYPGDSFNRIHWPSTARTNRLIVKEFESDPIADVWLFLDMHSSVQAGYPPDEIEDEEIDLPAVLTKSPLLISPSTEEYAVAVAASLAKHFLDQDRAVGLLAHARRREIIQSDRGDRQLTKILETLAVIRSLGSVPLADALAAERQSLQRDVSVVAITSSADASWVEALRDLGRLGIQSAAMVIDAHSFGATEEPDGVLQALANEGIRSYRVRKGQSLREAASAFVTDSGRAPS